MTRQQLRHIERVKVKRRASMVAQAVRAERKRELLSRQARREKEGFYSGRTVADAVQPKRSHPLTVKVKKGQAFGRILREVDGMAFHATKGWRTA